ncbi:23301_t:CDS:2 [Racocetra persica]|uniref:23301_t:CDS:1 n=1 Tax=Racocetra persica TaxID=160502 RepID=A0ACA9NCJ8_9GLOM|nr:23301_t:CDS:2 [Racocetra persica]
MEKHNEDDIDISTYFEETYCNKTINNIFKDLEPVSLKKRNFFDDFEEAESHHVNLSCLLKNNPNFCITVTTLNDEHSHDLSPKIIQFEKGKQFTEEMRKKIEFLVTKCQLGATIMRRILRENDTANFYDQLLSKQREDSLWFIEIMWKSETNILTNLFWMSSEQILLWHEFVQNDNMQSRIIAQAFICNEIIETYQWVLQITKKMTNNRCSCVFVTDGDPAMEQTIFLEYPEIKHLFCIWHVKQNIKKMLCSKLKDSFNEFYSRFWQCRNADMVHGFEYYWEQLVSFLNAKLYFERYFYKRRFSWACAFTTIEFMLGIQSMLFIKTSIVTVFPAIESLVKQYLGSNVSNFLIEQMKESLYYIASCSTIKEVESLTIYEPSQSKDMDDESDAVNLSAKYFLDHLEQNIVEEI